MVSAVVESDKKVLSSLEKEEVFIANTTRLAKLVFDIQHEQKVTETYPLEGSFAAKGVGSSRPKVEQTSPAVREDDPQQAAVIYVGRRLREIARENEATLIQAFNEYVAGIRQSIWDIDYDTFQRIMRDAVNSQQDNINKVLLTFAGAFYISEVVRVTGNDESLQEDYVCKFAGFVATFINDHLGLMSWVEQQGGWEKIGTAV